MSLNFKKPKRPNTKGRVKGFAAGTPFCADPNKRNQLIDLALQTTKRRYALQLYWSWYDPLPRSSWIWIFENRLSCEQLAGGWYGDHKGQRAPEGWGPGDGAAAVKSQIRDFQDIASSIEVKEMETWQALRDYGGHQASSRNRRHFLTVSKG